MHIDLMRVSARQWLLDNDAEIKRFISNAFLMSSGLTEGISRSKPFKPGWICQSFFDDSIEGQVFFGHRFLVASPNGAAYTVEVKIDRDFNCAVHFKSNTVDLGPLNAYDLLDGYLRPIIVEVVSVINRSIERE